MAPQLPKSGTCHTSSSRIWYDPDQDDVTIARNFDKPYSSAPDIITALNFVDVAPGDLLDMDNTIGVKVSAEEISGKQFTLQFGIWGNGRMAENGCNWLEIMPGDTRYRSGEYRVNRRSVLTAVLPVVFDGSFAAGVTPKVVVWLSGFQMAADDHWYLSVTVAQATHTGFDLNVDAPYAALHQATICWFAYEETDPHSIQSGTFSATDVNVEQQDYTTSIKETARATFGDHFTSPPRIIQGISSLKIGNGPVMTLQVHDATAIDATGFNWKVGSWGATECSEVGVSYLAILDPPA